jgi:hypothetical protein
MRAQGKALRAIAEAIAGAIGSAMRAWRAFYGPPARIRHPVSNVAAESGELVRIMHWARCLARRTEKSAAA